MAGAPFSARASCVTRGKSLNFPTCHTGVRVLPSAEKPLNRWEARGYGSLETLEGISDRHVGNTDLLFGGRESRALLKGFEGQPGVRALKGNFI